MPRGGKKTHLFADQYGDAGVGDDRFDGGGAGGGTGGGGTGGGGAGKRTGAKGNVSYTRRLPKFLQAHAALLGVETGDGGGDGGAARASAFTGDASTQGGEDYGVDARARAYGDEEDVEGSRRAGLGAGANRKANLMALAFDDDDSIAEMAARHKGDGNRAFQEKRYDDAVACFSRAAALEPTNWVYFSNRSAAYGALGRWNDALTDAKETVRLNSEWGKGYVRLATACAALDKLSESVDAWRKAVEFDEENEHYKESLAKAETAEELSLKEGKFTFQASSAKRKESQEGGDAKTKKKKKLGGLSFDEEQE